ncbi:MAG TPA: hypothetical protein VJL87_01560 [Bdellovibrionota bacterium]|nr:hypothetical protein [Bdellovibrionota bacterium]
MKIIRPQNIKRKILPYDVRQIVSPLDIPKLQIPMYSGVIPENLDSLFKFAHQQERTVGVFITTEEMGLSGGTKGWLPEIWANAILECLERTKCQTPVVLHLKGVEFLRKRDLSYVKQLLDCSIRGGLTSFEVILEPKFQNEWNQLLHNLYCAEGLGWFVHSLEEPDPSPYVFYRDPMYGSISSEFLVENI